MAAAPAEERTIFARLNRRGLVEYIDGGAVSTLTLPDYVVFREARLDDTIDTLQTSIAAKATPGEVNIELDPKATKAQVDEAVALKQDIEAFNDAFNAKIDLEALQNALANKANVLTWQNKLSSASETALLNVAVTRINTLLDLLGVQAPVFTGENPRFTSNTTVANDFNSVYGWDTNKGWAVSASSIIDIFASGGGEPYTSFDKIYNNGSAWHNFAHQFPAWLQIDYPKPVVLQSYSIRSRDADAPRAVWYPTTWRVQGKNSGTDWITLETDHVETAWSGKETKTFIPDLPAASTPYTKFRLLIDAARERDGSTNGQYVCIGEWRLNPNPYIRYPYEGL